ncbi:MAG: T9SS type A sorting domain-containing protein [Candidatus Latescibacter sp.]|nr:T9SS type A sorting domain-containing protein [Candidatus Latescibacter sp.]
MTRKSRFGTTVLMMGIFCLFLLMAVSPLTGDYSAKPENEIFPIGSVHKTALESWPRKINPLHALVVFTKFKGETPGDTLAPPWAKDLFNGQSGSVNDFFKQVSFGQYAVTGEYLPKMYEMPQDTTYYRTSILYSQDIIRMLDEDPTVNLALYDNDGLDGKPNSGDDDGFVDYIVLVPRTRPYDFIMQYATGVMNLMLKDTFITHHPSANGGFIKVDSYSGSISTALNRYQALGTIVAEIGHAYGAEDLMDKVYPSPEDDSAGVGYWCFLGHGALGWGGITGFPVGPCAYNRMLMNCIGVRNVNLVDIGGTRSNVRLKDVGNPDGKVYRIRIGPDEYFLIEYRNKDGGFFYDTQLPKSGLLIWHIQERESNSTEEVKLSDLECADGLYWDYGYPKGIYPDPETGKDNLDFWAHDVQYTLKYNGNLGDSTDVFDGVNYTAFGNNTNPSSRSNNSRFDSGVEIFNIRKSGEDMLFDCVITSSYEIPKLRGLPLVGLAFQKSKLQLETSGQGKAVFLMNFGLDTKPEIMVSVSDDSLKAEKIVSLSRYETQRIIEQFLRSGEGEGGGFSIVRENVTPGEFENTAKEFGLNSGEIFRGASPRYIQKLTLVAEKNDLPFVVALNQNFPNPFNSETIIPYILSKNGVVTLEIYNLIGQKILAMDQGYQNAGSHILRFKANKLPSGLYFYRLHGSALSLTKKFMIIR